MSTFGQTYVSLVLGIGGKGESHELTAGCGWGGLCPLIGGGDVFYECSS